LFLIYLLKFTSSRPQSNQEPQGQSSDCGRSYCEQVPDYPSKTILELLDRTNILPGTFDSIESSFQQLNMKIGFLAVPVTFVSVFAIGEDTKPYQPVLFPDEFEQLKNGDSTNKIKLFSETSQIWDFNVEEYPLTQIQNILERDSSLLSYFLRSSSEDLCPGCVDTRFLPEEEDENICEERSRYIFPKGANNTKEKFMFIVNLDDRAQFRQKVKVTTCLNPGGSCGRGDLVLEDIETSCRQVRFFSALGKIIFVRHSPNRNCWH